MVLKKVGKFFKKNLRDIATVVGFVVGGPAGSAAAGAAIGQGVGSLAEGRSFKDSVMSAGKVYTGGKIAQGFGITGDTITPGSGSFGKLADGATAYGGTSGSFLEGIGGALRGSNPAAFGEALKALPLGSKAMLAGQGLNLLGAFDPMEQPKNQMPAATSPYLTRGLTPATLSNAYSTAGIPVGLPGGGNALASSFAGYDPINQAYAGLLDQGYGDIAFPEFQQQPIGAKFGGGIAKLMDGGELPQMDLREHGGDINDPEGSGDEDTVPALLADGEFVMTKQAVTGIGNGNHDTGIANLYAMMDKNENKAQSMGIGRA